MSYQRTLVAVIILCLCGGSVMADRVLSDHNHTTSSDSSQSATGTALIALLAGADFVVATDHMEMLEQATVGTEAYVRYGEVAIQLGNKAVGFEAWADGLNKANNYFVTGEGDLSLIDQVHRIFDEMLDVASHGIITPGLSYLKASSRIKDQRVSRVIAGAEVGLGPACKIGDKELLPRFSHFKVLGGEYGEIQTNGSFYYYIMRLAESAEATASWSSATEVLRKIVAIAHRNGAIVVAAHPLDAHYPCLIGLDQVDAVEYFNHSTDFTRDTPFALHFLQAAMIKVFQRTINTDTGGDWHGPEIAILSRAQENTRFTLSKLRFPQLERYTIVQTDSWDPKVVIETLAAGKAYGTVGEARFAEMTVWPAGHFPAEGGFRTRLTGFNRLLGTKALFSFIPMGAGDIRSLVVDIPPGDQPVVSAEMKGIVKQSDRLGGWLVMLFGNQLTAVVFVDPLPEKVAPPIPSSPLPPPSNPTTQPQQQPPASPSFEGNWHGRYHQYCRGLDFTVEIEVRITRNPNGTFRVFSKRPPTPGRSGEVVGEGDFFLEGGKLVIRPTPDSREGLTESEKAVYWITSTGALEGRYYVDGKEGVSIVAVRVGN